MAAPTVTSFTPASGSVLGGTYVAIVGTNFVPALTTVTFGTTAATTVVVQSPTHLTCVTPAATVGTAAITVTTPLGTVVAGTFTYLTPTTTTAATGRWTMARSLNVLAGTLVTTQVVYSAQAAANLWATVTGFELVSALNIKATTTTLDLNAVCNALLGAALPTTFPTPQFDAQGALTILAHQ